MVLCEDVVSLKGGEDVSERDGFGLRRGRFGTKAFPGYWGRGVGSGGGGQVMRLYEEVASLKAFEDVAEGASIRLAEEVKICLDLFDFDSQHIIFTFVSV